METQVEVWENEKLQSEHKPIGLVFPRYFVAAKVVVIVIVVFIARFNTGLAFFVWGSSIDSNTSLLSETLQLFCK